MKQSRTKRSISTDRERVSNEPWEIETIHKHFPQCSHEEVVQAVEECKRELAPSEDRSKIMKCLENRLVNHQPA
jgi:hypothetical protein